jgi:hypothetical protein
MAMRRFVAVAVSVGFAGLGILGSAQSTSAAINSVTVAAANPSVTATCPVEVSFTGSIKGSSGTQFSYSFVRIVDNVVQSFDQGTVTMPGSGSIAVNDKFSVASSTSAVTQEQVWVHNISGGQADVFSTPAGFAVTCRLNPGVVPNARPPVTLHPQWFARRSYAYVWHGIPTTIPEQGTAPCLDLCVGWLHIHQGDSLTLYHENYYYRGFLGYDRVAIMNRKILKAVLTLTVGNGSDKCFGGVGRAMLSRSPVVRGGAQRFEAPYPDDGDFSFPAPMIRQNAGTVEVDVTSLVEAWAAGKVPNEGFVLRGKLEDNGSNGNDQCSLGFHRDASLTLEVLPSP